ncbi:uncharacterized protein LOC114725447 [Neltuma alba]|uniref:uncharacterized protein LOC114725447 n=1 Tax=Neltuma alba TaxID=207710 RepID=UPI0010A5343B|nr:uncharacterized protein LOC114725447 [Prosopis alba]
MGNCCRKTSAVDWDGDDWGSLRSSTRSSKVFDEVHAWSEVDEVVVPEKKQLLGGMGASSSSNNGKVTIKMSKKELEELMGLMGKKEREGRALAEQVLVRLLSARDHHHVSDHHRPWRPVLQSIPELD